MSQITPKQLTRLQVLYSQLAAHELGVGTDRESRMRWATERLRKPVTSFRNLSVDDAGYLIDSIRTHLGVKAPLKKRLPRDQARRAGLDGRKDGIEYKNAPEMVRESDLRVIQRLLSELNWGEDSLRKLLDGGRSPLGKRADKQIRTVSDANHVIWALKRFARQRANANKGPA
jgi:hypothetical protein